MDILSNIKSFLELVPVILEFFVPGYIFLELRNFFYPNKKGDEKYFAWKCIILSYILIQCIKPFLIIILNFWGISESYSVGILIIIVIIISILYIKFDIEQKIINMFGKGNTVYDDFLSNIIDFGDGAWLKLYLKSEKIIYTGKLYYYDFFEKDKESYIVLCAIRIESYKGDLIEDNSNNDNILVAIKMVDIARIEVFK